MPNDMTPTRGFSFKDFSVREPTTPIPGSRLDTEFDRLTTALKAHTDYLTRSIGPDGRLLGRIVSSANLHPDLLRDFTLQNENLLQPFLARAEAAEKNTQAWLLESRARAQDAIHALNEAQKLATHYESQIEATRLGVQEVAQQRAITQRAASQTQVRQQDAETSAHSARLAEDMAYRWAEKVDGPVFAPADGDPVADGFYSSKWWATWAASTVRNGSYYYLGPHPSDPTEGNYGVPLEPGMWYYNTTDQNSYIWNGTTWNLLNTGGTVTTFNGRDGAVVPEVGDYSQFYALKSHTHTESQITDLDKYTQAQVDAKDTSVASNAQSALDAHAALTNNPHQTSFDDLLDVPGTFPPSPHTHTESQITDLDRTRWRNVWAAGTYEKNDIVYDQGWLMVANKQTTDRAAPQDVGSPLYRYTGDSPTSSITAKSLLVGNVYTAPTPLRIPGYRVYTVTGNTYSVFLTNLTTGEQRQLISFTATATGWWEAGAAGNVLTTGTQFELGVYVTEPDPTPTTFSGTWNYLTPNNEAIPVAGEIIHAGRDLPSLRVSTTDDDAGDRRAELLGMAAGDIIVAPDGLRWAVQAITDNTTWFDFTVAPARQSAVGGVQTFTFETVSATPITTVIDTGYYAGDSNVRPYFEIDGGSRVQTDDGYGLDVLLQEIEISPDWDLMSTETGSGTGGEYPEISEVEIVEADAVAGWQVWGDVLMCWGSQNGEGNITFPKEFKTPPNVTGTIQTTGPATSSRWMAVQQASVTETGFIPLVRNASGDPVTSNFNWFAVGEATDADKKAKIVQNVNSPSGVVP